MSRNRKGASRYRAPVKPAPAKRKKTTGRRARKKDNSDGIRGILYRMMVRK